MVEDIVAPISLQSQGASNNIATEIKDDAKRPAPSAGGCRIEGFVRVKKVGTHYSMCLCGRTAYVNIT